MNSNKYAIKSNTNSNTATESFRYNCNLCQYGVEKRNRLITHMAIDHNITVKLSENKLVSEQPDSIRVYSNEDDPDLKKYSDSIIKLDTQVPRKD